MKNKKVNIKVTEQDEDVYEFEIRYSGTLIALNCYLQIADQVLILKDIDVDGPGQGHFGKNIYKAIDEICKEFCKIYNTKEIILIGSKRAAGRTKGTFLNPIRRKYDNP